MTLDFRRLRIGASFLFSGQILQAAIGFAANLVLVRHLFPEEFGRFALILAIGSIVLSISTLNMRTIILRTPTEAYSEERKDIYFSVTLYETIVSFSVLTIWLVIFEKLKGWELALILALGIRHWTNANVSFFEREMPFQKLAIIETLSSVAGHLIAVSMVMIGSNSNILFIREVLISLFVLIGLWTIRGLTIRRVVTIRDIPWLELFRESRGLWLDTILENSFNRIIIVLIYFFGGDRAAGYFFQAQRLAGVPLQFLAPIISRVAAVWFGRTEDRLKRREGRNKLLIIVAVTLTPIGVICFIFADRVVAWLFGDSWLQSGYLLSFMAGVVVFHSLFEILKSYCWQSRQVRWLIIGRIAQYFGCGLSLIWGFTGLLEGDQALAIGQSLAFVFGFVTLMVILERTESNW